MEDRLRKFASLVDAGSFTKAAAVLHISQPALSTAIAKLERELKARLVVRGARPLALTAAGRLTYQTAKDLSVQTDNLRLRLNELANRPVTLKIGMIDSIATALFSDPGALDMLSDSKIEVVVNNSRYLSESVERGDLDIALVVERQGHLPSLLDSRPVGPEPLVVVCHPARQLSADSSLPDFIAYDQPSTTHRLVAEALRNYGVTPVVAIHSTSPEVMLRLVLLNKGTAALPYLLVREHLESGRLKRLGAEQPWLISRNITALQRRDRELPQTLKDLTTQTASVLRNILV
jgi:DNA-binding transcriptional LysR family regulator